MKTFLFLVLVAILSVLCGVAANSFSRPSNSAPELTGVPVTKVAIEPDAPLSIGVIAKTTARVFNVQIVNVSGKSIQGFDYTYYKQCATATIPAGGAVGFVPPEKLLKPGEKFVFHAGEDDPVQETSIQNCIDSAKEIRLQIKTVSFADGTIWKAISGDFPRIRSSSP